MDAAGEAVLSKLDVIFKLKEKQRTALLDFLWGKDIFCYTFDSEWQEFASHVANVQSLHQ